MKGLSGFELQERLIADGHRLPIIFVTALCDEETASCVVNAGAIGCLGKPVSDKKTDPLSRHSLGKIKLQKRGSGKPASRSPVSRSQHEMHSGLPSSPSHNSRMSLLNVRFGSLAEIRERIRAVRFTPESRHSAGLWCGRRQVPRLPAVRHGCGEARDHRC